MSTQSWLDYATGLLTMPIDPRPFSPKNPHFRPLKESSPIPVWGALLPPLTYFLALSLLPPFENISKTKGITLSMVKFALAITSIISFAILPFWFHVPGSAILTYQLGLIGCFGAGRAFDLFILSHPRVPKRLAVYDSKTANTQHKVELEKPSGKLYPNEKQNEQWNFKPHPTGIRSRLWWALDLMISMRGVGWDFATPDVRHDTNPWQRPSRRQLKRAIFKLGPVLAVTLISLRMMITYIDLQVNSKFHEDMVELAGIGKLPIGLRPLFVACTGISLYALFDFGYTIASALALPVLQSIASLVQTGSINRENDAVISAHNIDFFPLLNPLGLRAIRSVRSFWSKAWHRLFHRAFLIYGIIPFRNLAIRLEYFVICIKNRLQNKPLPQHPFRHGKPSPALYADPGRTLRKGEGDWGKVLGAFIASGVIHAISERAALGGRTTLPNIHLFHLSSKSKIGSDTFTLGRALPPFSGSGELSFFVLNGLAVIIETAIGRMVLAYRRSQYRAKNPIKRDEIREQSSIEKASSPQRNATQYLLGQSASTLSIRPTLGATTFLGRRTTYKKDLPQDTSDQTDSEEEVKRSGELAVKDEERRAEKNSKKDDIPQEALSRPYDIYIQIAWTLTVLLTTGELFTEGWIASGVVNEITMVSV
ncbi:uncharacterized protein FA14DRAFT_192691 [Meira miltonrushii]|uniref:Wax synthase domain-containing protein n=1 Tax=Meira miltonrushii TaxID=1280837 RepID=A0A316V825_9BASI|nr:uncharacterized protein FA14DRAFT_192691 [Meira miltonrushii]PWN31605.1 hypothetical protein FA14DRAFT_192691 [Meira miltonrushii]